MCDVNRDNFTSLFPEIEDAIRKCDFIAVDTEFSTLVAGEDGKSSLFDDIETRYRKYRNSMSQAAILQFGLSIFRKDPNELGSYESKTFNFYLCPQSQGLTDSTFVFQASTLEFLAKYQFDFNKFVYTGVSYMNEVQEQKMRDYMASNKMFSGLERAVDEDFIQDVCSKVADWIIKSEEGDEKTLYLPNIRGLSMYVVRKELKSRFPCISVKSRKSKLIIMKLADGTEANDDSYDSSSEQDMPVIKNEVVEKLLGFTNVFRVMKECKKPIVGHNMFLDLLLIYDKFHKPLPPKYTDFKRELHQIFPVVFDTKHLLNTSRKSLEPTGLFQKTILEKVFSDLNSREGKEVVLHQPRIEENIEFTKYTNTDYNLPHEAGWDAYMCGYVFLKMAHIVTFLNTKSVDVSPCTFQRYMSSMSKYVNNINMIRGYLNYIYLAGADPPTLRPDLLYFTHRKMWQTIDIDQVANMMSKYGVVDVKPIGKTRVLIAAGNFYCARDILKDFKDHKIYYITKYRMWKHSYVAQGLLWSGFLVSGSVCVWALLSGNKKQ